MPDVLPNMEDALAWEVAQDGDLYIIRRPISFDHAYNDPQGEDCSELQLLACRQACILAGKPQDWLFPYDVSNTVGMYLHAQARGWLASVPAGVALRGAIMLKGRAGGAGAAGHTAMSGGNVQQFAAHSSHLPASQQVGWAPMYGGSDYQDSIIFPPDIAFYPTRDTIPVDPKVLQWLASLEEWAASFDHPRTKDGKYGYLRQGDTNHRVTVLVNMLILRGLLDPSKKTNTYNGNVVRSVRNVQHSLPTPVKGGRRAGAGVAHWLVNPSPKAA